MLNNVVGILNDTMGEDPMARNNATDQLQQWAASVDSDQGYIPILLEIVDSVQFPEEVRMAAVIQFKNIVKNSWDFDHAEHPVNDAEREMVRGEIVGLMLRTTVKGIRNVVEEAIRLIAEVDFPQRWGAVVNEISRELYGDDFDRIQGALSIAHGIFVRYRKYEQLTEELRDELLEVNRVFTTPLLDLMEKGLGAFTSSPDNVALTGKIITIVTAAIEVFHDLVFLDMGEEHVALMDRHMNVLLRCIQHDDAAQLGTEYEAGPLIALKTTALEAITHFLQKYDEEMESYVETFTHQIWDMLKDPANESATADNLVIGALDFLSCICQGVHHRLLDNDEILHNICQSVIVPNMTLTVEEVDMFEDDPTDYIERDIEGSDFHTRRRSSFDLVRSLMVPFENRVGAILYEICQELLVRATRSDWKAKNTAIFVLTALAIKGGATTQRGVSAIQINANVPIKDFYDSQIVPELRQQTPSEGSHWIIKADCMRFLTIFRHHLDSSEYGALLHCLGAFLAEPQIVVHTYAAHAIERILMVVDEHGALRIAPEDLASCAPTLLANLCSRLMTDKRPNAYTIQCLMRVISVAPQCVTPYVGDVISALAPTLAESAKNPSDPLFNHNLFEAISQTINADPSQAPAIEAVLWDTLILVLQNDVVEFVPYTLQVLAQLLDAHPAGAPIPAHYLAIAPPLVTPVMYENKGNIPAVIRLLAAFVKRGAATLHNELQLTEKIIAVFQHLAILKQHDHDGLNLLTVVMMYYPNDIIDEFMLPIIHTLLTRLKNARTPKFLRLFNIFLGFLIVHRTADYVVQLLEEVQRGMFVNLLDNIFLANIQKVTGAIPRKVLVVAAALLIECQAVQNNANLFVSALKHGLGMFLFDVAHDDQKSFAPKTITVEELRIVSQTNEGFTNVYCPLKGATAAAEDPCGDVADPQSFFISRVQSVLGADSNLYNLAASRLDPQLAQVIFN